MSRCHSHTLGVARIIETRERLLEVLDKDRKELADYQEAQNTTADEPSSERFARNMALIRLFESEAAGNRK
jgi:hypothetical protein